MEKFLDNTIAFFQRDEIQATVKALTLAAFIGLGVQACNDGKELPGLKQQVAVSKPKV